MTTDELIEKLKEVENADNGMEKMEEILKQECLEIEIHYPHLDDHLRPRPETFVRPESCTGDGKCYECDRYIGAKTNGEPIFAFSTFTGYCKKNED